MGCRLFFFAQPLLHTKTLALQVEHGGDHLLPLRAVPPVPITQLRRHQETNIVQVKSSYFGARGWRLGVVPPHSGGLILQPPHDHGNDTILFAPTIKSWAVFS